MDRPEHRLLVLWKQVFGDFDGFWETFFCRAYEDDHCLCLEEDGKIQAALYWFDCECSGPWAYIFAVATDPECRGRGLCRRLMEKTHTHLKASGYHGALLVPAEEGLRRMYEKMGYREGTVKADFSGQEPQNLRPLRAEEYAAARKQFLPAGGVEQTGKILNLLEAIGVGFYEGEGCLLAREENRILEYLEKDSQTLDRTKPFAMVHPLREDAAEPQYFAFALD